MGCGSSKTSADSNSIGFLQNDQNDSKHFTDHRETNFSFAEFPTHVTLAQANKIFARKLKGIPQTEDGTVLPFPSYKQKQDVFKIDIFLQLDKYAEQTPQELLRKPVDSIVSYLNKRCKTDLEKVRAYFRWLTTRDIQNLPVLDDSRDHENAVLKELTAIRQHSGSRGGGFTKIIADMCRIGGIQFHVIKGKVRTRRDLEKDVPKDDYVNDWVAVFLGNEWRLIDVHFAVLRIRGSNPGKWELIDDNGEGYREVKEAPAGVTYNCDENYFLMNPEEFIYSHRPFDEKWQLLARPVTFTEFQEMAFLKPTFFENKLCIGDQKRMRLYSSDGEIEIRVRLPEKEKCRFVYHLWRSTKSGKLKSFEGFELSQFVLLEQRDGLLCCRVVFPLTGDYKLDLFANTESYGGLYNGMWNYVCSYLIHCDVPRKEWNALPRNPRNEWGFSHEMHDLGLQPITHQNATIETDDGYVEIRFKCTKDPVDSLVKLRGLKDTEENMEKFILFRQNETQHLVIYLKLPSRGLYALDLYGKPWGRKGNFPHVATYLIAATSGAHDLYPYPIINAQLAGETSGNTRTKLKPVSQQESIFTFADKGELKLQFETSIQLDVSNDLYFWFDGKSEDFSQYVFKELQDKYVTFRIRFTHIGTYSFEVFAKPNGKEGTYPRVFTYVIFVQQSNPEWIAFPKQYNQWKEGCSIDGLMDGELSAGGQGTVGVKIPDAEEVVVLTEGNHWTHLEKDTNERWQGNIEFGRKGKLTVLAMFGKENDYGAVLECKVKTADQLEKEKQARIQKQRNIQKEYERKNYEKECQRRERETELQNIELALQVALKERDLDKLRSVIARIENNNYTERLQQDYEKAKELKKSMEKIARLRQLVISMDQRMMSVIRSYARPPPVVHATMRATFLLLGNDLNITEDWKTCKSLSNTIQLNKRVRDFDIKTVSVEKGIQARKILDPIRLEEVQSASEGAATFYIWTLGMTEEIMIQNK